MEVSTYYAILSKLNDSNEPSVILMLRDGSQLSGICRMPDLGDGALPPGAAWFSLNNPGRLSIGGFPIPRDIIIDIDAVIAVIPL